MPRRKASVTGLLTATRYSFSSAFSARRMALTMSPLLVSRIRPSESLSRRPIGKIRSWWSTKSVMFPATPVSVVHVMPTGLYSAMYTCRRLPGAALRTRSGCPSRRTSSPSPTSAPIRARWPLTVTRPSPIRRSASRREQAPVSLMCLLRRMEGPAGKRGASLPDCAPVRSFQEVGVSRVPLHPGVGIAAQRPDLPALDPGVVEGRLDQLAGDAAAADGLGHVGMGDVHDAIGHFVI